MWTCALQNRNGICAQLSLIRLRCSYEEALCPCLPIKRIAKPLIRLGGWPGCGFVRFSMICFTRTGPYNRARGWKMSINSFQRWASDNFGLIESRAWSKRRPYMGSTGPVFAAYCKTGQSVVPKPVRRLHGPALHLKGHLPKPVGYTYRFMLDWAKNRENTQRTRRMHVTIASQEGDFVQTSHGPQTPIPPQVLRARAYPWVSCMRPKH